MENIQCSDLDNEITELVSLSPSYTAAQGMKTALLAALTLHAEDRQPDSTETAELEELAARCPYEYGSGVHTARALLSLYDTSFVNRLNPCEIPVEPELRREVEKNDTDAIATQSATMFPNPSSGKIIINLRQASYGSLKVYDFLGRNILVQDGLWNLNNELDFGNLPNGIYIVKFNSININQQWKLFLRK